MLTEVLSQRSYWIDIPQEFPGTRIDGSGGIVFKLTDKHIFLITGQNHPTITDAEQGLLDLRRISNAPPLMGVTTESCMSNLRTPG